MRRPRDGWPTPVEELILRAAILRDQRGIRAWEQLRPQIDLPRLDGASIAAIPALRSNLLALGVDDPLFKVFKGVHRHSWARNQLLLNAAIPVIGELERAGIPTMLLKGAALVSDDDVDTGIRPMADVDLLVRTEQLAAAVALISGLGLRPFAQAPSWYVTEYAPRFVPSFPFVDPDGRELDLHWHVLHTSCQPDADEDFWSAAVPLTLRGVRTAGLCPTDALLHVILHGLRWNETSGYRWVLDAVTILDGSGGAVDYDRLVEQARRRRVTVMLRKGLAYLSTLVDAPIPKETLRALTSPAPRILERLEFPAQLRPPARRGALRRTIVTYQSYARRHLALGDAGGPLRQLRLARECFGIRRLRDILAIGAGGTPGPGRPASRSAAALGQGSVAVAGFARCDGEPVEFADADLVHACVGYGAWLPEPRGCWLAGRQALIVLALAQAPTGSLLLDIWGEHYLFERVRRMRVLLRANGRRLAAPRPLVTEHPRLDGERVLVPADIVAGRPRLELMIDTPDAVSPAQLGDSTDDRQLGFFLHRLVVRAPLRYELGSILDFGEGGDGAGALVGGWSIPEPTGRWTDGPVASLLLSVGEVASTLELTLDAEPFIGRVGRRLDVDVHAGPRCIETLTYGAGDGGPERMHRVSIAASDIDSAGELLITLRMRKPRSPLELGLAADPRKLGLHLRRLTLTRAQLT